MSEQPEQPPPCATDIFEHGVHLLTVATPRSFTIEEWIQGIRVDARLETIDWSFAGGYAIIKAIGSDAQLQDARGALKHGIDKLIDMYIACEHNQTTAPYKRTDVWIEWP